MGTYTYPGVYIQEVDTGNKPIEGVSTSIAGFLGIAERGPLAATFLSSFADYQRSYGGYFVDGTGAQTYLAYAVEGFFLNGGQGCWVARVASGTAGSAQAKLANITISAAGPGATGAQIGYYIQPASIAPADATKFRLQIYYWSTAAAAATKDPSTATLSEVFDNLSTSSTSSMYFVGVVNSGSDLVTVAQTASGAVAATAAITLLTGPAGADPALVPGDFTGVNSPDPANPIGLAALDGIDDISIYCCPDEHYLDSTAAGDIAAAIVASCENSKDRFAILQSAANAGVPAKVSPGLTAISQRGYSAFYYPWVNFANPTTGIETLIAPGGHIAGIYARSDANYSVAKDPANEQIQGIDSLQLMINNATQGQLNPIGVNCLRSFKTQGNLVFGGRTTSPDPDWQYISIRRLFIYIEKSIQQGTQWVVFQPNDSATWARVIRSISDFLTGLWMQNMLMGATKEQAFFVRCDNTTMTQTDIDSGRLIATIGVAPVYPAEFVIFRIGQWSGGASVTELSGS